MLRFNHRQSYLPLISGLAQSSLLTRQTAIP